MKIYYLKEVNPTVKRGIKLYTALVMIPMVLVFIPVWSGILDADFLNMLTPLFMWTPAIAAFIVLKKVISPTSITDYMAMTPFRPFSRILLMIAGVLVGGVLLVFYTLTLSNVFGFISIDTVEWLGYRSDFPSISSEEAGNQVVQTLWLLPLYILGYMLLTTGEELGWRGFLHTAMIPIGFWKTTVFTAVVWVVWHLPLIFTSAFLGDVPWRSAIATTIYLFLTSFLISAIRERSGSVWPAAFAHALLNTVILFGLKAFHIPIEPNNAVDFWGFTITGWAVWMMAIILLTYPWINYRYKIISKRIDRN